jgi:hypothetical protein
MADSERCLRGGMKEASMIRRRDRFRGAGRGVFDDEKRSRDMTHLCLGDAYIHQNSHPQVT